MLKGFVSKVFGFDREIEDLRKQVQDLSIDTAYGMWTRPAFNQFCEIMPRSKRSIAFIDLDNIHNLDLELGYAEVDRRIQAIFSVPFRRSDVVARWYSGDEIVILFDSDRDGADMKMKELGESAREQGMTFKFAIGEWDVGKEPVDGVVEVLSNDVAEQKRKRQAAPAAEPN